MLGTVAGFRQIMRNFDRTLNSVASRPDVKRETEYYLANIRSVKSADEFIDNDRLYSFAMTAFGLADMIYGKAFMRKVLREGLDGEKSFALQLADQRFREFAETFNFARYGEAATAFDRAQQGTVDRFFRIRLEADAGKSDEGVRLALYFQRKAPAATSVYGLMADAALYRVVQTALGLPKAYSSVDIDKQAALIGGKLDIADLKDPAKLDALLVRFTARWQAANATSNQVQQTAISPVAQPGFDNDLLLRIQNMRQGGSR